jgi:hypothetical protein
MLRSALRPAGRHKAHVVVHALGCLLAASPAMAQSTQMQSAVSVSIEQPVGGSFTVATANRILTAIFRSGSTSSIEPNPALLSGIRTRLQAFGSPAAASVSRSVVYSYDAIFVGVHLVRLDGATGEVPFVADNDPGSVKRGRAVLILANFN